MKRKRYTIAIVFFIAFIGVAYWLDLSWFINPITGFTDKGPLWLRYAVILLAVGLSAAGLRDVSPHAIGLLRIQNSTLAGLFGVAGVAGFAYGFGLFAIAVQQIGSFLWAGMFVFSEQIYQIYLIILGISYIWYGLWMLLAAKQMKLQDMPSPTKNALPGILASMPFCLQIVYRVLINPSSTYRMENVVSIFSAMFSLLWFGMLLRALYIALVHKRVRWMYFFGLITFLFAGCLESVQILYGLKQNGFSILILLQGFNTIVWGLLTAAISVSIAGQDGTRIKPADPPIRVKKYYKEPF